MERLKMYEMISEIDLRQILTITSDNGSNVLKMVRDIGDIIENSTQEQPNTPTKSNMHSSNADDRSDDSQVDG